MDRRHFLSRLSQGAALAGLVGCGTPALTSEEPPLRRAGAHILPSETVFYALLRDVSHPFFRGYTQLVKTHHERFAN